MNINFAKQILIENGYIVTSTKKSKRIAKRLFLQEQGYNTKNLVPLLTEAYLTEDQNEELKKFKQELNKTIATNIKLKQQKQTDEVKEKEKEQTKKSFGLMNMLRGKWGKRAWTALRAMTVAAGLFGAPLTAMEDGVIEFEADHGAYELSNDGIEYVSDGGHTVFSYEPDTGNVKMADGLSDQQIDLLNKDLDNISQKLAQTYEFDDIDIHAGNPNAHANTKTAANNEPADDDDFDMSTLDQLNKLHDIKMKMHADGINDVDFAHLTDPDYHPSDDEIDNMSQEEQDIYALTHNVQRSITDSNNQSIKTAVAEYNTAIANNGRISLTELLNGADQMKAYMEEHGHEINDAEPIGDQYMRAYLMDNGYTEDQADNLADDSLKTAYEKVHDRNEYKQTNDADNGITVAAELLDDDPDENEEENTKVASNNNDDDDSENA